MLKSSFATSQAHTIRVEIDGSQGWKPREDGLDLAALGSQCAWWGDQELIANENHRHSQDCIQRRQTADVDVDRDDWTGGGIGSAPKRGVHDVQPFEGCHQTGKKVNFVIPTP